MRYLPHSDAERADMLATIGVASAEALFSRVPAGALLDRPLDLPLHQPEYRVEAHMRRLAAQNRAAGDGPFFVGAGAYRHHVPATVDHLIQRSEWLTAYTPYQPEVSQGTLQVLFEFQTQVARLTGMDVANASMYDGSTGTAEAVLMARRVTRRSGVVLSGGVHPHYRDVVASYVGSGPDLVALPAAPDGVEDLVAALGPNTAALVVQTPDFFGTLRDLRGLADAVHAAGALLIVVVTEVISLGLIEAPGAFGADIVVCEGQSLGNALNFGGPYVGLFATRKDLVRQMPGRLCGETVDADGQRGFVLTLSTREQHIRREKATSNICTNAGLCALAFSIHLSLLGEAGLTRLARLNHARALRLRAAVARIEGVEVVNRSFFNELTLRLSRPAAEIVERLASQNILAGVPVSRLLPDQPDLDHLLVVAATELTSDDDIDALAGGLAEALK